jgi:AcrR family transcriptional regulator
MGLRERKKERARRELERAALELFEKNGFEGTTIKEIAAAAEMSPRTFFRYFETKEDVIFAHAAEDMEALRTCLARQPMEEGTFAAVRAAMIEWADHLQNDREMIALRARLVNESAGPRRRSAEYRDQIIWSLAEDLTSYPGNEDTGSNVLVVGVCSQTLNVGAYRWSLSNFDHRLGDYVKEAFAELEVVLKSPVRD